MDKKIITDVSTDDLPAKPTPEQVRSITQNVQIQEEAKKLAEELRHTEQQEDQFAEYITATKERLDKHFDHLGYVCFIFDKNDPKNSFMSNISNVLPGVYLNRLIPYVSKHKHILKKIKNTLDRKLKRMT